MAEAFLCRRQRGPEREAGANAERVMQEGPQPVIHHKSDLPSDQPRDPAVPSRIFSTAILCSGSRPRFSAGGSRKAARGGQCSPPLCAGPSASSSRAKSREISVRQLAERTRTWRWREKPRIGGLASGRLASASVRQSLRGGFAVLSLALKFAFPGNRRLVRDHNNPNQSRTPNPERRSAATSRRCRR